MKKEKPSIIDAIENVTIILNSEDEPTAIDKKKMNASISLISSELSLTEWQALFVVAVISEGWDGFSGLDDICEFMKCSPLRVMQHKEEVKDLLVRQIVRFSKSRSAYGINDQFVEAVATGKAFEPEHLEGGLGFDDFWKSVLKVIKSCLVNMSDVGAFIESMRRLCELNRQIVFADRLLALMDGKDFLFKENDIMVFVLVCNKLVNKGTYFEIDSLEELMGDDLFQFFVNSLKTRHSLLFKQDLLQYAFDDGSMDTSSLMLSDSAVRRFLPGLSNYVSDGAEAARCELRNAEDIVPKVLYYNHKEEADIKQLSDLLQEDNYKGIKERMLQKNYRSGFAALFYGAPGTGKTETALQLARNTGRNIFQVNFAELRSMWVGESEKNVKGIFSRYRNEAKVSSITPILLFNEADSIIGTRLASGSMRAVDKMENTIQNIILQEMESLDGIMIATTNLTQNIDKAFDRRFLYKVKFEKPAAQQRAKIWQAMVEGLPDSVAASLAQDFDLSGGQIENVARRNFINHLLYGTAMADLAKLENLCRSEIEDSRAVKKVGF